VLLSLFFQDLGGYPVMTVGLLLTPRGLGAFTSMFLAGLLIARMDPRLVMAVGFVAFGLSAYLIAGWTTEVSAWQVAWTGILQGFGSGLVWVPMGTLAVATLTPRLRDESLAFFHMMFNVGASLGIITMINLALRTSVSMHASLTEYVTRFNQVFKGAVLPNLWNFSSPSGLAALNLEITRQSGIVGYNNCFYAIAAVSLAAIPLCFLLRRGAGGPGVGHAG
jgi:DHA2 family multidrug resistance protein